MTISFVQVPDLLHVAPTPQPIDYYSGELVLVVAFIIDIITGAEMSSLTSARRQPSFELRNAEAAPADSAVETLRRLVLGEFLEVPGLALTGEQIQRLWNIDEVKFAAVMGSLCAMRFLTQTPAGAFIRMHLR